MPRRLLRAPCLGAQNRAQDKGPEIQLPQGFSPIPNFWPHVFHDNFFWPKGVF